MPRPRPFSAIGISTSALKPGTAAVPAAPAKPVTPAVAPTAMPEPGPSACRLHLTSELAIAPSVPSIEGPGECGATDLVRLEAIVLPDGTQVTMNPPATMRCTMAEAVVSLVRTEAPALAREFGTRLRAVQNYDSYDCRGRNRVVGA